MDLWRWVQSTRRALKRGGHGRLASILEDLPAWVCDDDHGRVDAVVPEAIALARAANDPWVEVFVRHWALQSRVLHRYQARTSLAESVALLEFANREPTRRCPQSVCVTQDLAACYACADGPGYVPERLEVAAQTLDRIDPSWPCFTCISDEYAAALMDDERHAEALEWLRAQTDRAVEAGAERVPHFVLSRTAALLGLGRADEAWALIEDYQDPSGGAGYRIRIELLKARVLAALDRADEALRTLPSYEAIEQTPGHYDDYARATVALVERGAWLNDAALGRRLRRMMQRARDTGANFLAARLAALGVRLAQERGAWEVARLGRLDVEQLCAELRRPQPIRRIADAPCEARPAGAESRARDAGVGAPPTELGGLLLDDPERALERLGPAIERDPDEPQRRLLYARALRACGFEPHAEAELRRAVERLEPSGPLMRELGGLLLDAGRDAELRAWLARTAWTEPLEAEALWLRALSHQQTGELDEASECLEQLLRRQPGARLARERLAAVERQRRRYAQALAHLDQLVRDQEPGNNDWDRMTVATILGAWAKVRESASRLALPSAGPSAGPREGPVDTPMGRCRLRFTEPDGRRHDYIAERRGPVTARVLEIAGPERVEHHGDLVAFDADPLERPRGDAGHASPATMPIYAAVEVIEPGRFRSWSLDGAHPGEAAWTALTRAIERMGGAVTVRSDETYRHVDPNEPARTLAGIYALACAPLDVDVTALHARLDELTRGWAHPLVWVELAEALPPGGARERVLARFARIADRYEL